MCAFLAPVLLFRYHFPIKGTKIFGEMDDTRAGQRKYKMILKILWCQEVK